MPTEPPRPADGPWGDVEGVHISLFCRVEQVAEHPEHGALLSRRHQRGQVVGRGPHQLYIHFEGEGQLIGVSPQLLRLLPDAPGGC